VAHIDNTSIHKTITSIIGVVLHLSSTFHLQFHFKSSSRGHRVVVYINFFAVLLNNTLHSQFHCQPPSGVYKSASTLVRQHKSSAADLFVLKGTRQSAHQFISPIPIHPFSNTQKWPLNAQLSCFRPSPVSLPTTPPFQQQSLDFSTFPPLDTLQLYHDE